MSKYNFTFNFKKIPAAKEGNSAGVPAGGLFYQLPDESLLPAEYADQFEAVKLANGGAGYKRKSIVAELNLPDVLQSIAATATATEYRIIEGSIKGLIADFVRATYLEYFLPIGPHDLETIAAASAASGGRGASFSFTPEQFTAAVESFKSYILESTASPEAATRLANAANAKFSRSSFTKYLSPAFDEALVKKVIDRISTWALWLSENDAATAEELSAVYGLWVNNLDKLLKVDTTFDLNSVL
jgi:hypothetical protein